MTETRWILLRLALLAITAYIVIVLWDTELRFFYEAF
jgi:hypothetical protein